MPAGAEPPAHDAATIKTQCSDAGGVQTLDFSALLLPTSSSLQVFFSYRLRHLQVCSSTPPRSCNLYPRFAHQSRLEAQIIITIAKPKPPCCRRHLR